MKIFKNSILSLKIASCEECPNRTAQRYKTPKGFSTIYVCSAISRMSIHRIAGENPLGSYHPPIQDAKFSGGFLFDCPLEEI